MKKLLFLLFLIPHLVMGENKIGKSFPLSAYIKCKNDESVLQEIGTIGYTASVANAVLMLRDKKMIYCQPLDITLNRYNYERILEAYLAKTPDFVAKASTIPLNLALIYALEDKFPCN